MSVNNSTHGFCSVCGKSLEYQNTEVHKGVTMLFYACPEATLTNNHDRAVYEIGSDVETA